MARFDLARFGAEVFRPSPRQADLMIVAGTVTKKMAPQVVRLYNQMPEPKYVIAMGACAISGGPFKQGYNVLKGIDRYIPGGRAYSRVSAAAGSVDPRVHDACRKRSTSRRSPARTGPRHLDADAPSEFPVPRIRAARFGAAEQSRRLAAAQSSALNANSNVTCANSGRNQRPGSRAAVPGAKVEIIPNDSPSGQRSLLLEPGMGCRGAIPARRSGVAV